MVLVYVIAGEASGDVLGGKILSALQQKMPDLTLRGVGGVQLQACGVDSLFPMEELSLMGFWEILPHIPRLKRRMAEIVEDIDACQPDLVLSIDSPGFTYRVAAMLQKDPRTQQIKRIHVVAPTVWAYKPKRAAKTARLFDALLCLLPFEPPYFVTHGLQTHFIGHPVTEHVADASAFTAPKGGPLIVVMPGSRAGELRYHLPIFAEALQQLQMDFPDLYALIPTQPHFQAQVKKAFAAIPHTLLEDEAQKFAAFAAADIGLCKSGTSSLELAQMGLAHIVAYKVHPLTAWLVRRMVHVPYASLVNLLHDEDALPAFGSVEGKDAPIVLEYIQKDCTASQLYTALGMLLTHPQKRKAQQKALQKSMQKLSLSPRSPSEVAADNLKAFLCD